ncbi:MAG: 4-hydroxythreonine-4-phosphate dehydrogenase PdxA [Saprospirales bacterium]|nr:4-hydroxythreonine-4-phosphate dehydrogenase PdxA [Saprospirales bacterium]MBK7336069.1 4-hydroxythreonine-4-phosphate dehydrogenase PdxA [Saprospirales bacterium]
MYPTKPKIGISIGDINGIGLEVILKTLAIKEVRDRCIPIIYGSSKVVSYHKNIIWVEDFPFQPLRVGERPNPDRINVVNCWQDNINITLGKPTDISGKYAIISLEQAAKDLKEKVIDALVTAPVSKEALQMAQFPHVGHTEYLTQVMGAKHSLMMMVEDELRVGLVTNHLPINQIASTISKELILAKLHVFYESLKVDFGLERPTIAVLALNPHASDGGLIGNEEERFIRPAVVEAKKGGMMVLGPFPADGFFGSGQYKKYNGILAMYHDQGLIPFKTLAFGGGINFTAGLAGIRTSPDHGTGFDIAGKNMADHTSFLHALFLAIDLARNRNEYVEMHANALIKREKPAELEEEASADNLEEDAGR